MAGLSRRLLVLMSLLATVSAKAGCIYKDKSYSHLEIILHDNGCAKIQCQFGVMVIYYEACGKEVDGNCHRLNFMFEHEGHTYKCRKIQTATGVQFENALAIPRIENCTFDGRTYQTMQKFRSQDGCTEYQCHNGVVHPLHEVCSKDVDGKCHLLGEFFVKDGLTYNCTRRDDYGHSVYENQLLDPQPSGNRSCGAHSSSYRHLEILRFPESCHRRQCQNKAIKVLTQECSFKQDNGACYAIGEEWTFAEKSYECIVDPVSGSVKSEVKRKGYGKCQRVEKWYQHLEVHRRDDICISVQCQDGKTPIVDAGCVFPKDGKCYDLNLVWEFEGTSYKCILTADEFHKVFELDENGNLIDKEVKPEEKPDFGDTCDTIAADIVFIYDSSGSIGRINYQRQLNFSCSIISAFKVGPKNVQVGAVVFSDVAEKVFDLNTYSDYDSVCKAIQAIPYLQDITETHKAFDMIVNDRMFGPEAGGRPGVVSIVIVITDGNSTNTSVTLAAADRVKALGCQVISIGIGRIAKNELYGIASRPENVFNISTYDAIFSLKEELTNRTCNVPIDPPVEPEEPETVACPDTVADIIFLLDSSTPVGADNYDLKLDLAINVTKELSVSANHVRVGAVLIGSPATILFDLKTHPTRAAVDKALETAPYLQGDRETDDGLRLILDNDLFATVNGGRDDAARILIVFMDGLSVDLNSTLTLAKRLRNEGVRVITLGLFGYDRYELVGLSGDERNVFGAASYSLLNFVKTPLYNRICEATKEPRPGPEPPRCRDTVQLPCDHICENTDTGYKCICRRGYAVSRKDRTKCEDVDECLNSACQQVCTNTVGSYQCSCRDGYRTKVSDPSQCQDINECQEQAGLCEHACTNTAGSYKCSCNGGYIVSNSDPNKCKDVDECLNSPCQQVCTNTVGSYQCSCRDGYRTKVNDPSQCQDINECQEQAGLCEHACANTAGSYKCRCNGGYIVSPSDPNKCKDIDECLDEKNPPCHQNCTNTEGSFECSCRDGYTPNECDVNTCKDIDECEQNPCQHLCENTRGGFLCSCRPGFAQSTDDFTRCEEEIFL